MNLMSMQLGGSLILFDLIAQNQTKFSRHLFQPARKCNWLVLFVASGLVLCGPPVFAAGALQVVILAPGDATVTLTAPDGAALTQVSGMGELTLRPKTAGVHRLTITLAS